MMKFIKDTWRKKEVVSMIFLNIKSTFPSVVLNHLIHTMRVRGIPKQYIGLGVKLAAVAQCSNSTDMTQSHWPCPGGLTRAAHSWE